jgi:hypothetical protein
VSSTDRLHWPFAVEGSLTPQEDEQIRFLQSAADGGFDSFRCGTNDFGAESGQRSGYILERGRRRWEVRLLVGDERKMWAYVEGFSAAASAVLKWLESRESLDDIASSLSEHLTHRPNSRTSLEIIE